MYKDKEAQKAFQKKWVANRRAEFFKDKICISCGTCEKLELDHIIPEEKTSHNIWSWSAARRDAEIAKCQILCKTCHLEKTLKDRAIRNPLTHGLRGYDRMCRCDICKAAKVVKMKEYRSRIKAGIAQLVEH